MMRIKLRNNYTLCVINAYAPTLPVSEDNLEVRETFYDDLEAVLWSMSNRDHVIIAGDFNAETRHDWKNHQACMGRYGKGEMNSSGKELLEFFKRSDLILTNTTWISPITITDETHTEPNSLHHCSKQKLTHHYRFKIPC